LQETVEIKIEQAAENNEEIVVEQPHDLNAGQEEQPRDGEAELPQELPQEAAAESQIAIPS
jgi:hypothetical protein